MDNRSLLMSLGIALGVGAMSLAVAQTAPQSQSRSTEEQKTMPPRSATASAAVDATTPPPVPRTSQGAEHAAGHSAVATRETFGGLDKDKDGRVSSTEAGADAGFDAGFAAMDANGDGFVSDTEYRAHSKASGKTEDKQP